MNWLPPTEKRNEEFRTDEEILTTRQLQALDRAAIDAGTPLLALVGRAGAAVAQTIQERWSSRPTLVLCGPGANGADGLIAARRLAEAGWPVQVALHTEAGRLKGIAAQAARGWTEAFLSLNEAAHLKAELVVDAMFGAGLNRGLSGSALAAITAVNAARTPVVAVDLPSGLDGDTGAALGVPLRATLTVSFHRKKPAHVLAQGRALCGEVVIRDIGLSGSAAGPCKLWEDGPSLWLARFPWPRSDTHKTERGRMMVVSGHAWNTGAARLAARAGLRMGAGLVTLLSPPDALASNAAHLEAVMLKMFDGDGDLQQAAGDADVVVIGPAAGVSPQTRLNLMALARTGAALVVDADVLTSFAETPEDLFAALDRDDVLTPHPGEFERVFPGLMGSSPSRIEAARSAAERAGAIVILKGPDTVVAAPDGRAVVNTNGTPWLATAGSGDVLAGLAAGLIAQGMESFDAASAAVWIHAQAAATFGPGLISEDLPSQVPAVLRALLRESADRA